MIGAVLLLFVIMTSLNIVGSLLFGEDSLLSPLWNLVTFLLGATLTLGVYRIYLDIFYDEQTAVGVMFSQVGFLPYFIIASVLYGLAMIGGLLLLIIPGVFVAVKFYFFDIIIVDKKLGPIGALQRSWNITKGRWWSVFGLLILLILFNLAGMLALLVGLLVTVPVSWMAMVCAYRFMSSGSEIADVEPSKYLQNSSRTSFTGDRQVFRSPTKYETPSSRPVGHSRS